MMQKVLMNAQRLLAKVMEVMCVDENEMSLE